MTRFSAAQVKSDVGFDNEPSAEFMALLETFTDEEIATGRATSSNPPKGLISEDTSENFKEKFEKIMLEENLKKALAKARANRKITLKEAAAKEGISLPRAQQIENADTKLEVQTLVRHAAALDYSVSITLTPKDGVGETITAKLSYP